MQFSNMISATILAIGVGSAGFLIGNGYIGAHNPQRTVQVKGLAEKKVKANLGEWQIQYKVLNDELPGLYNNIEAAENKIKDFLQSQGFKANEIAIQPQTINDNKSYNYNTNAKTPRFSANGGISVYTNNVDGILRSSQQVGQLVKEGVVITGTNMRFRYTKLNSIKPNMLLEATINAKKAGQTFAKQSESILGPIKNARQGVFTITDANSNYSSEADVMKKVRVVSTITFLLD